MNNLAVENENWKPIKLSRKGLPLTHLAFVDDILLFAEANEEQINVTH